PVVLLLSDGPLVDRLAAAGVETHVRPVGRALIDVRIASMGGRPLFHLADACRVAAAAFMIARFLGRSRINLVHTNSLKSHVIVGLAARLAGIPVVWHVRNRIHSDYLPAPALRMFCSLCHVIPHELVAVSAAVRDMIIGACGPAISGRTAVVHDGVDPAEFTPPGGPGVGGPAAPVVGLVGRISPFKGQDVFVRAAVLLADRFPRARFRIIGSAMFGEAEYERRVRDLVAGSGMRDRIEITGFCADVPAAMRDLDLVVHASTIGEPFGQVLIEAMAAGKPVVATNGGGVPEIVADGQTGLLVPMNDAEAMAGAIAALLACPDRAREMGQNGRRRATARFGMQGCARGVQAAYDRALDPVRVRASGLIRLVRSTTLPVAVRLTAAAAAAASGLHLAVQWLGL
ncbi:MAG: glycosyltransferase, partial [Phycisphaerae bacterium]